MCKRLPLRAGRLTREQPPRVFVVRCRPPLRKLRQQSHTGTRFLTNSLARPKTEEEEEKEEGEKASAGNKRRGRDKWRIDATVIYVDPLPAQPSLVVKEGTVVAVLGLCRHQPFRRHLLLAKIRHKPPIATIALYPPPPPPLSLPFFLSACMGRI